LQSRGLHSQSSDKTAYSVKQKMMEISLDERDTNLDSLRQPFLALHAAQPHQ